MEGHKRRFSNKERIFGFIYGLIRKCVSHLIYFLKFCLGSENFYLLFSWVKTRINISFKIYPQITNLIPITVGVKLLSRFKALMQKKTHFMFAGYF